MRIKELRTQNELRQQDVANALNVSQTVYSRYESEVREPPLDVLVRLAEYYGVTVDYLIGVSDSPSSSERTTDVEETMYRRPGMRVLFDAAKNADEETLQKTVDFIEFLKNSSR